MAVALRRSASPGATLRKLALAWMATDTSAPASVLSVISRAETSIFVTTPTVLTAGGAGAWACATRDAAEKAAASRRSLWVVLPEGLGVMRWDLAPVSGADF